MATIHEFDDVTILSYSGALVSTTCWREWFILNVLTLRVISKWKCHERCSPYINQSINHYLSAPSGPWALFFWSLSSNEAKYSFHLILTLLPHTVLLHCHHRQWTSTVWPGEGAVHLMLPCVLNIQTTDFIFQSSPSLHFLPFPPTPIPSLL